MKAIASRLAHNVNVRACASPVARVKHSSLHFEFFNRVGGGDGETNLCLISRSRVLRKIIRIHAIELKIVRGGLGSICGNILIALRFAKSAGVGNLHQHARVQGQNLSEVAVGERQRDDCVRVGDLPQS